MKKDHVIKALTILELVAVALVVYYDMLLPTVVILGIAVISMLLRREQAAILGLTKHRKIFKMGIEVLGLAVIWTLVDFGIILPVLNHITGTTQHLSTYQELRGNVGLLLVLLAASWTLAAFGEEIVYRGYIQARVKSLFKNEQIGLIGAVATSSMLFGLAHTEQGIIGVAVTTVDAIFFSVLRHRYKSLWASVLAHGFMNSIGIITFYFTGPLYGLW